MDATVAPEEVGLCGRRLGRVRHWMQYQVESGRLPGLLVAVERRGRLGFLECHGQMDLEAEKPLQEDTIFRVYSMTKPITSVAALMLYEEGRFQLDDPISRYLPEFAEARVAAGGEGDSIETVPAESPITIRHLMTHTAGLGYGLTAENPVDRLYRERRIGFRSRRSTLQEVVERVAALPLLCQPGAEWNYSCATDVLGRLVEVLSGQTLERFLQERILGPLDMADTGFHVPPEKLDRFAACYERGADGRPKLIDPPRTSIYAEPPALFSGGGGLLSTARDYLRFTRMLRNKGRLGDVRLLGRKTVELMTSNHLPGDMAQMGQPVFSESTCVGIGFGLGVSVLLSPERAQILGTPGEYAWGGMASTAFWVDPGEDMIVLLLTQLQPSSTYPLRRELRVATYQAIVD